jgi:hypothetical protein
MRGRIGAYSCHSRYSTRQTTAHARAAALARFEDEVDKNRVLVPEERERRAAAARKAYFTALAYRSARSRARRHATNDVPELVGDDQEGNS